ncbi:phospholipase A1-like [Pectinophora gossypiella]|uniref:phospholipase A1-like n=1 Tax=Pectinophora gossypiella TaxID=13191 RepID=UPI00214F0DA3|nr:phospholipase A1-like [Pectinophora gossypiella]
MSPSVLPLLLACLVSASTGQDSTSTENSGNKVSNFFNGVNKGIQKEIADAKHPVEVAATYIGSSQCSNVKKIVGVSYESFEGDKEPDLSQLTLDYITSDYTITYKIDSAARSIPQSKDYDPHQKLFIFFHGFTDDPTQAGFSNISTALFATGHHNVLGLDASSLIKWLYLRSSTYVRYIGEKMGEVVAALVQSGVDPDQIHIIGHSLGAHISGFTGKQFKKLTGLQVARISGLDPAGPCFSHVDEDLRLLKTDAKFVDVIHSDGGVFGLIDPIGHVDYYPNDGSQQPDCLWQTCSHSRSWLYYTESVLNNDAFPAVKCDNWEDFKKGDCGDELSYMGFPSEPGTTGKYYLQTAGESPFGLGINGTTYQNDEGVAKKVWNTLLG